MPVSPYLPFPRASGAMPSNSYGPTIAASNMPKYPPGMQPSNEPVIARVMSSGKPPLIPQNSQYEKPEIPFFKDSRNMGQILTPQPYKQPWAGPNEKMQQPDGWETPFVPPLSPDLLATQNVAPLSSQPSAHRIVPFPLPQSSLSSSSSSSPVRPKTISQTQVHTSSQDEAPFDLTRSHITQPLYGGPDPPPTVIDVQPTTKIMRAVPVVSLEGVTTSAPGDLEYETRRATKAEDRRVSELVIEDTGRFHVVRASHPRVLKVRNAANEWTISEDEVVLADMEYLVCSYSHADFQLGRQVVEKHVQDVCNIEKINAYWIDLLCSDVPIDTKSTDLYCVSDIYRGAKFTVVLIHAGNWGNWRAALWSLPAVLLSPELMIYEIGSRPRRIALNSIKEIAYTSSEEATKLIDAYTSDTLHPLVDRVNLLQSALWKHSDKSSAPADQDSVFGDYAAERIYALMGFMQYRIFPDPEENEVKAWNRFRSVNKIYGYLPGDTYME